MVEVDADGEDDPEFVNDSGIAFEVPLGLRKSDGTIVPIAAEERDEAMEMDGVETNNQFFGRPEPIPSNVRKLVSIPKH